MSSEDDLDARTAAQWRAVAPDRWTSRWPLLVAWVLLFVVSTIASKEGGCTVAAPCTTNWGNAVDGALAVAAPVLVLWMPRVGVLTSWVAVASYLVVELRLDDLPHALVLTLSGVVVAATLVLQGQLTSRRRAEEAHAARVATARWTGPTHHRPGLGRPLGAGLLAVGIALGAYAAHREADDRRTEQRADVRTARVLSHDSDGYKVTLDLGDEHVTVDSNTSSDYPVGSEQQVYVDGDDVRLVAAPHDEAGWGILALGVALLGLASLLSSVSRDRELRRLLERPQPQYRVRLHESPTQLVVLATDQQLPVLAVDVIEHTAEDTDEPWPGLPRSAVLHGRPVPGRPVALQTDDHRSFLPVGNAKRVGDDWRQQEVNPEDSEGVDGEDWDLPDWQVPPDVEPVSTFRVPTWRRVAGAVITVGACVGAYLVTSAHDGVVTTLYRLAIGGALWTAFGLDLVASGVVLTDTEVVVKRKTGATHYPWSAVTDALVLDGQVGIVLEDGDVVALPWPTPDPWPFRERAVLRAQRHAALLRQRARTYAGPAGEITEHPRVLGPLVAVLFVVVALAGLYLGGGS